MPLSVRDTDSLRASMEDKELSVKDSENEHDDRDALEHHSMHSQLYKNDLSPHDKLINKSPKEYDFDDKPKNRGLTPQKAASPLVIQWLQDNYEAAEGTSLPRSTLYTHYVSFCSSMNIEPVNAASFGKLIRSIFPNLKTRRLGTRGHSKYHYYGIRIKATSELRLPTFNNPGTILASSKPKPRIKQDYEQGLEKPMMGRQDDPSMYEINGHSVATGATNVTLPDFHIPENLPSEISTDLVQAFMSSYKQHCQALIDAVFKHHFLDVDKYLHAFWQSLPAQFRMLVSQPEVVELIGEKDQLAYKAMATVLLPNVLQALPVSIPQSIRQFAKQLEAWLNTALEGLPPNLVAKKMHVVKKFSQSLHKQASLNHLTQAARAVLQNTTQVSQMIIDWNRLDFEFIKDQASWICQCGDEFVQSAQEDFKRFLTERASLEQWAQWLQDIVNKILGKCIDPRELVLLSQQLLLKWSFYSTLIIRDLTIRNASSFGSFHLLRTLFDEYIFYLVETRFASLVHIPVPANASVSMTSNYEVPSTSTNVAEPYSSHSSSMESFSLDTLLNKDNGPRVAKHLPYPFHDNTQDKQEEEYARLEMLHPDVNLLHLNVQPYQQQQYQTGRSYASYIQPKSMDEMRMNQMSSSSGLSRMNPTMMGTNNVNVGMTDHSKRTAAELMRPAHIVYNFASEQQMRPQYIGSYESHPSVLPPSTNIHYREPTNDQGQNKKIRLENGIQSSEVK